MPSSEEHDADGPCLDGDDRALEPFVALADGDGAAFDGDGRIGMNGVVARGDGQLTVRDGDGAVAVDGVVRRVDRELPTADRDRRPGLQGLRARRVGLRLAAPGTVQDDTVCAAFALPEPVTILYTPR